MDLHHQEYRALVCTALLALDYFKRSFEVNGHQDIDAEENERRVLLNQLESVLTNVPAAIPNDEVPF